MKRLLRYRTLLRLGLINVLRVGIYKFGVKIGLHPVLFIKGRHATGPFYANTAPLRKNASATDFWLTTADYFAVHRFPLLGVPDWHLNPFQPHSPSQAGKHWAKIPDFDPKVGDIKIVWEASRFDWLVAMAQRASLGDELELNRLNIWLDDWSLSNPPYLGPNWKCGQEASIRVMHIVVAAIILGQTSSPSDGLRNLLRLHLARIAPTTSYAVGQQNNHGTSEAAALFIGGTWLESVGETSAASWSKKGRKLLENRARALIENDGTFSQYSVVYHRVMLDTYSLAETWRARLNLPPFSNGMKSKLQAATNWLNHFTDLKTGNVPNLGANDGARLIPLSNTPYRDFRPSLQLAARLFSESRAIDAQGPWDQPAIWLDLSPRHELVPRPKSAILDQGGFHILRQGKATAYLRYPRYHFRPGQCDALHLDFWLEGQNLLRDAGSYSYNTSEAEMQYFKGNSGHNTIEFDGRDQMPRVSRFLLGAWLASRDVKSNLLENHRKEASAGYRDYWGAEHHRDIKLENNLLTCTDRLTGGNRTGKLRWRLEKGNWTIDGHQINNGKVSIAVRSDGEICQFQMVKGYESLHYLEKQEVDVLEVETSIPSTFITEIRF